MAAESRRHTDASSARPAGWVPDPTPKAIERSHFLEETVKETWGTVCFPAAAPTSVLFTFLHEPFGPSTYGWVLDGKPWNPPDTIRSVPPTLTLKVSERWRTASDEVDELAGVIPAVVEGAPVVGQHKPNQPDTPIHAIPGTVPVPVPTRALRFDPIAAARGVKTPDAFTPQELTLVDLARRANAGLEVSRSMMTKLVVTRPRQLPLQTALAPAAC